jgi:hypothetical protein
MNERMDRVEFDISDLLDVPPTVPEMPAGLKEEIRTIMVNSRTTPGKKYAVSVFASPRGGREYRCHCDGARLGRSHKCWHVQFAAEWEAAQIVAQPGLDRLWSIASELRCVAAEHRPATIEAARSLNAAADDIQAIVTRIIRSGS